MSHKLAVFASFGLALAMAVLVASQWDSLASRQTQTETTVVNEQIEGQGAPVLTEAPSGALATTGLAGHLPVQTTDPNSVAGSADGEISLDSETGSWADDEEEYDDDDEYEGEDDKHGDDEYEEHDDEDYDDD